MQKNFLAPVLSIESYISDLANPLSQNWSTKYGLNLKNPKLNFHKKLGRNCLYIEKIP